MREALRAGQPEGLVGLPECAWLDVKGEIYVLDTPYGAEELLKDVAAFANAQGGGLLLVGFSTTKENGQEIIDLVRPVPRAVVDIDRHRKLLDRIIPVPRYVSVDWVDCGDGKGILVIDVPAQPPAYLAAARRAAAEHQDQHRQPITRDALRARLGVSTQAASDLLRQLRATQESLPPGVSRIDPARRGLKGEQP